MGIIDIDSLLAEVSPDTPCGEDLEYGTAFGELERSVQGKPEQQMGDTLVPAESPDWRDVQSKALELLSHTKDLRVLVYLTRALTHTSGFLGFADGVTLLRRSLGQYWEPIHPQLDSEDDHDPTMRVNILGSLGDPATMLRSMREAALVSSHAIGRFSLRDIAMASGAMASGELAAPADSATTPPAMSTVEAAFIDCALEELQATAHAINDAIEQVIAIEAYVTNEVGAANARVVKKLQPVEPS
jgi:type VI secretion system protein ImpA